MQALKKIINRLRHKAEAERPVKVSGKWSIGIFTGTSALDIKTDPRVTNPVLTAGDVSDVPANFVADPFMVQDGTCFSRWIRSARREILARSAWPAARTAFPGRTARSFWKHRFTFPIPMFSGTMIPIT